MGKNTPKNMVIYIKIYYKKHLHISKLFIIFAKTKGIKTIKTFIGMSKLEKMAETIFYLIVSISILIMCIGVLIWSGLTFFVGMVGIILAMILHYIISVIDLFYKEK